MSKSIMTVLNTLRSSKSFVFLLVAFIAPIGFIADGSLTSRCAYVITAMTVLWLTEALPMAVTALLPIFLFPFLAVQSARTVCANYCNDTSMLYFGGLIVGVAMDEVKLNRRIAMWFAKMLGAHPNTLLLSVMMPTWFLSMWINNTVAAAMMLPMLIAISEEITTLDDDCESSQAGNSIMLLPSKAKEETERLCKGLSLGMAYASNIGGISTLTGTPSIIVLKELADRRFQEYGDVDSGISYITWLWFGFPLSLLLLFMSWIWLHFVYVRSGCCKSTDSEKKTKLKAMIKRECHKLGSMKFGEVVMLVCFILLTILWITRELPEVGGWGDVFTDHARDSTVSDSTAVMIVAVLLFVLPSDLPNIFSWSKIFVLEDRELPRYRPILSWAVVERKVTWGVLVLLGGGFALADACDSSGLSSMIGCELRVLRNLDPWLRNLVMSVFVSGVTEVINNTTTSTLLMPIMFDLAIAVDVHPLNFMITAAVVSSFSYMLPISSPPNALVFSTGHVRVPDMAFAGFVMKTLAVGAFTLAINTWGMAIFDLDTMPAIFRNSTHVSSCSV